MQSNSLVVICGYSETNADMFIPAFCEFYAKDKIKKF